VSLSLLLFHTTSVGVIFTSLPAATGWGGLWATRHDLSHYQCLRFALGFVKPCAFSENRLKTIENRPENRSPLSGRS